MLSKVSLLIVLFVSLSGCLEKCEVMLVVSKSKCTFDRDENARVCVVRLGKKKNLKKGVRGRVNATRLPEPLIVGDTQVKVCSREGRRFYEKI